MNTVQTQAPTEPNKIELPTEWFNYIIRTTTNPEAGAIFLNLLLCLYSITEKWPELPSNPIEGSQTGYNYQPQEAEKLNLTQIQGVVAKAIEKALNQNQVEMVLNQFKRRMEKCLRPIKAAETRTIASHYNFEGFSSNKLVGSK
ncbi:MAG: hypothetical protein WCO38_10375 [Verrucomicrobiota bacterium]